MRRSDARDRATPAVQFWIPLRFRRRVWTRNGYGDSHDGAITRGPWRHPLRIARSVGGASSVRIPTKNPQRSLSLSLFPPALVLSLSARGRPIRTLWSLEKSNGPERGGPAVGPRATRVSHHSHNPTDSELVSKSVPRVPSDVALDVLLKRPSEIHLRVSLKILLQVCSKFR